MKTISDLKSLLETRDDLKQNIQSAIVRAAIDGIKNIDDYYAFLEELLSEVPSRGIMGPSADKFHYIISQSPDDLLKRDRCFLQWLTDFSRAFGAFMDTTESALHLDTFINDPEYKITDYDAGPGGWFTFNQFFSRSVKPGKRPISEICNPAIIVSATDSTFRGSREISSESAVQVKGTTYSISDLLAGSKYRSRFSRGVFTHSYLDSKDYHRFHVPVAGKIIESEKIPGNVIVNAVKNKEGQIEVVDDVGFQFTQTRGVVVLDTRFGLVAAIPVGMGHVSSVTITADVGSDLYKGQEFGYFSYGGSDMVLLFESGNITFTAEENKHYHQGEAIGRFV